MRRPSKRSATRTRRSSSSPATTRKRKKRTTTRSEGGARSGARVPALVALGLGANLGEPRRQLLDAVLALSRRLGALSVAPLYRTAPISPIAQPDFWNTVALLRTDVAPRELLALAKELEAAAGRSAGPRWGPRPLDVDLLLVGEEVLRAPDLEVPHPRLHERAFVLAPLVDLAPELRVPPDGRTVAELLAQLPRPLRVDRASW